MKKKIRGFGGDQGFGPIGTPPPPASSGNATLSTQFATIVDLVSEGEIEGFADSVNYKQCIYLDGVRLQNPDGSLNYKNVTADFRPGTQAQTYMPGFSDVEINTTVGVEATFAAPATVSITDTNIDSVAVTVVVPTLYSTNTNTGTLLGDQITFQIQVQNNGGGYVDQLPNYFSSNLVAPQYNGFLLSGKVTSRYERTFLIKLSGSGPWDIRLKKKSDDYDTEQRKNKLYFGSYTQIISSKFAYPNSALVGMRFDASQFSSVPTRGYDLKLLKVRLPSNSTTRADGSLSYSGNWDGTFRVGWSSCPAWCYYDLMRSDRYGIGAFITEDQIDKWALYEIGKYCDALVDNGNGGTEPRYSCNFYIQSREEAFKVMQDMASIFRGMIYWANGMLTAVQDAPADPAQLFTPANVIDGNFNYSGASSKARHTVVLVTWNDPEKQYAQAVEYVEDQAAILRFGVVQSEIYAIGCTSRGQAARIGRWLLYTEQNESDVVAFTTGLEGAITRPGQIIQVADPVRAGVRLGGRIVAATSLGITIDGTIDVTRNGGTLYALLPDGTVEGKTVANDGAATNQINVTAPFSQVPAVGAMWLLSTSGVTAQTFRVLGVRENEKGEYEVSAVAHDSRKFNAVENNLILKPRDFTDLSQVPAAPSSVVVSESLYESQAEVRVKITLSWPVVSSAASYLIRYKYENSNWIILPETYQNDIDVLDVQPGAYDFEVVAVSAVGQRSSATNARAEIYGKLLAPSNVSNFSLIPVAGTAHFSWTRATDLDVLVGGFVRIRWTPLTTGQEWANSVDIIPSLSGTATTAIAPLLNGTYMAKFVDSSGISSDAEAIIVTTVPEGLALNVVSTLTESPTFAGSKTGVEVVGGAGLSLASQDTIDEVTGLMDDISAIDSLGNITPLGTYLFNTGLDLAGVLTSRVTASIELDAFSLNDFIDARSGTIDEWLDLDGSKIDDVFATLYMRTTLDDPAGTPTWTAWKRFVVGEYMARAFQFKLELSTADNTHNANVTGLSVVIDMPDRTLNLSQLTSGTGPAYHVTFTEPFYAQPAIGITAFNLATGDFWQITSASKTGFDIVFKNAAGTAVSRNFDVLAKGYGRQVA